MKAGALHTILADGVCTPRRAHNIYIQNNVMETVRCGEKNAGVDHLWGECRALNKHDDFGYLKLMQIRHKEEHQPK
eukprot:2804881-Heterocapsa_arctica.AAC.1